MEYDKNPFPKIDLFPRITRLTNFLLGRSIEVENTGGGPALDRALYDDPQLRLFEDGE